MKASIREPLHFFYCHLVVFIILTLTRMSSIRERGLLFFPWNSTRSVHERCLILQLTSIRLNGNELPYQTHPMNKHGAVSERIVELLFASLEIPILWRSARYSFAFSCRITAKIKKFNITFKIYFSKVLLSSLHSCIFHSPPPRVFSCKKLGFLSMFSIYPLLGIQHIEQRSWMNWRYHGFTLWIRHRRPWQNRTKKPVSGDEIQSLQPYRKLPILLSSQTKAKNVNVEPSWNKRRYRQIAKRTPEVHPRCKR